MKSLAGLWAIWVLLFTMAISQQNNEPRGGHVSSRSNQALEQCFNSEDVFICGVKDHGEMYFSTPAATSTTSGTPVKAAGTTTLGDAAQFDMPANNRLRYTGQGTKSFHCSVSVAAESDTGGVLFSIFLAKNGTADLTTEIDRQMPNPNDHGASGTGFIVELVQDEYVELWIDATAGSPSITVDHMTLRCTRG